MQRTPSFACFAAAGEYVTQLVRRKANAQPTSTPPLPNFLVRWEGVRGRRDKPFSDSEECHSESKGGPSRFKNPGQAKA